MSRYLDGPPAAFIEPNLRSIPNPTEDLIGYDRHWLLRELGEFGSMVEVNPADLTEEVVTLGMRVGSYGNAILRINDAKKLQKAEGVDLISALRKVLNIPEDQVIEIPQKEIPEISMGQQDAVRNILGAELLARRPDLDPKNLTAGWHNNRPVYTIGGIADDLEAKSWRDAWRACVVQLVYLRELDAQRNKKPMDSRLKRTLIAGALALGIGGGALAATDKGQEVMQNIGASVHNLLDDSR